MNTITQNSALFEAHREEARRAYRRQERRAKIARLWRQFRDALVGYPVALLILLALWTLTVVRPRRKLT